LFAEYLLKEKINEVFIASRDINNAITFADRFRCKPVIFENIPTFLNDVDIIFTSTGSNEFILNKEDFEDRKTSNLFIVDIAIPRDIDPRVGDIDSCFLYGLDDFKKLSVNEKNSFNSGINDAISIINKSVDGFKEWQQTSSAKDTMVALRKHILDIVESELKLNSDVDTVSAKITNKILHSPLTKIKEDIAYDDFNLKLIQELFDLELKEKDIQNKVDDKQNKNRN
jgi:glutamyl-tRNA reductase